MQCLEGPKHFCFNWQSNSLVVVVVVDVVVVVVVVLSVNPRTYNA